MRKIKTIICCVFLVLALQIHANDQPFGVYEKTGEFISDDIELVDASGKRFNLKDDIEKVAILSLVYYTCEKKCMPLLHGLADMVNQLGLQPGLDYQVYTIGYNPDETINHAVVAKEKSLALLYNKKATGWRFATADTTNIRKITKDLGLGYLKKGNDYMHPVMLVVLSPEGQIINYMFGTRFLPLDFEMTFNDALEGKAKGLVPRNLRYCTNYVPVANHILRKIAVTFGFITIAAVLALFFSLVYSGRRKI